jgi:AAA+ superfamily predicted ATPase
LSDLFGYFFINKLVKNVLVIGSPGLEKNILIQSIAGETELKMITDSAHRYAMVHRSS